MNEVNLGVEMARNTLDDIPQASSDALTIVALVKHSGKVTGYKLSDERIISKEEGIEMAQNGKIEGVGIAHRGETQYLKSIPDGTENNNLSSLPSISQ